MPALAWQIAALNQPRGFSIKPLNKGQENPCNLRATPVEVTWLMLNGPALRMGLFESANGRSRAERWFRFGSGKKTCSICVATHMY